MTGDFGGHCEVYKDKWNVGEARIYWVTGLISCVTWDGWALVLNDGGFRYSWNGQTYVGYAY